MIRISPLLALMATVALSSPAAWALDSGMKLASKGAAVTVPHSFNRAPDYVHQQLGPVQTNLGGRRTDPTSRTSTTNVRSGSFSAEVPVQPSKAGKGFGTLNSIVGRNDPMPTFGGRSPRPVLTGLGL